MKNGNVSLPPCGAQTPVAVTGGDSCKIEYDEALFARRRDEKTTDWLEGVTTRVFEAKFVKDRTDCDRTAEQLNRNIERKIAPPMRYCI